MTWLRWIAIAALTPFAAMAEEDLPDIPSTLIADRIEIEDSGRIIAEGNIEVFANGTRLQAQGVIFDENDGLTIIGPIYISENDGAFELIADQASLSADLQRGILTSAQLVLNQELQVAASEIHTLDGRYTQLYKTVASSCRICGTETPFWQIRAKRIIHDDEEKQLYFEDAQLRIMGVPVFYSPRLRLPDPSVQRATGFLTPTLRFSNTLDTMAVVPYFIAIGDHKDLTITPYLSTSGNQALTLRYRQAFRTGTIEANAGAAMATQTTNADASFANISGAFALPQDFGLSFYFEEISDNGTLVEYGLPNKTRTNNSIAISRARPTEIISADLSYGEPLQVTATTTTDTVPSYIADAEYKKRLYPGGLGGQLDLGFSARSFYRPLTTPDDGRDVTRLSAMGEWSNTWAFGPGVVATLKGRATADAYQVNDDSSLNGNISRTDGIVGVELRWPLAKTGRKASHLIEPVMQLVWSPDTLTAVPNEDSLKVSFDEGNLFSFSRFPGTDAHERGLRANLGLGWTRYDPAGWSLNLTTGAVIREKDLGQFTGTSGLSGLNSDWVVAAQYSSGFGLDLVSRTIFDDSFVFDSSEIRLAYDRNKLNLSSGYIWLEANASESRPADVSEWTMDATYNFRRHWYASWNWQYDITSDRANEAGIGLSYRTECADIDLSVARKYSSANVTTPTTSVQLTFNLVGFGASNVDGANRRQCGG